MFYAVFTSNFKVTLNDKSKSVIKLLRQGQSKPFLKPNWKIFPSQDVTSVSQKVNSKFSLLKIHVHVNLTFSLYYCHIRFLFSSFVI